MLVTLDDIRAAASRIRGVARRTPVLDVQMPSRRGGSLDPPSSDPPSLALKCENFQPSGAFKVRGACNMLAQLPAEARAAGVITYSSGNHGQAVALVARSLRMPAVIVMPETAARVKVDGVRRFGAEVIFAGTTSADRKTRAEDEAAARGLTIVPPFDHPWIIAGAGTVGLEILEQCPQATTIFVPMGGGGQISGVSAAVKGMRASVRVVGVEPSGAARMSASLAAQHPITLEHSSSIADGLLTPRPGDLTFAHVQAHVDEVVTVDDAAMIATVRWLFHEARLVAEPSGAAAVAAALRAGLRGAVAVVSGGNVDPAAFATYIV
jgi:threo-3-hydroxy-L-aspartate ammonia-lyase